MIIYGLMYFICIPSGYLLLTIYSLVNMHIAKVSLERAPAPASPLQPQWTVRWEAVVTPQLALHSLTAAATCLPVQWSAETRLHLHPSTPA